MMLTIEQIAKTTQPEIIFPHPDSGSIRRIFTTLVKLCHPDINPGNDMAREAFINLEKLRDAALVKMTTGQWDTPGLVKFTDINGRRYEGKYRTKIIFECGVSYVGDYNIMNVYDEKYKNLFDRYEKNVKNLPKYEDNEMKKKFSSIIPIIGRTTRLNDGSSLMVISKQPTTLSLRDILNYFGGSLDPKAVGWIVSRLLDFSCWLNYSDIAHYGLTLDNLFISPKFHGIFLINGWGDAYKHGARLDTISRVVADNVDRKLYDGKVANSLINQTMVRVIGRELCGDITGARLMWNNEIPKPMRDFLIGPAGDDPVEDFVYWKQKTLVDSFGPPKFIKMEVTADNLYPKI